MGSLDYFFLCFYVDGKFGLCIKSPGRVDFSNALHQNISKGVIKLAQPNFQYEKRQRDLIKKKKQEEKRQRKLDKGKEQPSETPDQALDGPNTEDAGKT